MGLANCPECGKLFVQNASGLCPSCYEIEEFEELKIVDFLREKGKASIEEICNATGVKEKTVLRMMKRGRFKGDFEITRPCETCGVQISEGRLCGKCSKNILEQVKHSETKKTEEERSGTRMYTKDFK
ncbi:flagellar protein [Dendrosporobacter sp. 1207_IL3150]|uniref:flagellar protein n=1 Tax=Dendrosporobacter sp. 1207_IL3150 TaxID=3084054 RepID=UPI002FD98300